jgi:hypothetical protein
MRSANSTTGVLVTLLARAGERAIGP